MIALLTFYNVSAQTTIEGRVSDSVTGDPIPFANVYFAGTTMGVASNTDGRFKFDVRMKGSFDLIVSFVGYQKVKIPVVIDADSVSVFDIRLKPEIVALNELIVHGDTTPTRSRDLREFLRILIGTTRNASDCTLKNREDVVVRKDKSGHSMTAYARAPLIIENLALGYEIHYDLERFQVDDRGTSFSGTVFFKELIPKNERQEDHWNANREMSYRGSVTHLIRSMISNRLQAEGWDVRIQYKQFRPSDSYIRQQISKFRQLGMSDSVRSYKDMLIMPANELLRSKPLKGREMMDEAQPNLMTFRGVLTVEFVGEGDPRNMNRRYVRYGQASEIEFRTQPHVFYVNGSYSPQADVLLSGYFVFGERLAEWVPYEYTPLKK